MTEQERRHNDTETRVQIAELRADVSDLSEKIEGIIEQQAAIILRQDTQTNATAALVEAWNTGTGVVKFIKWAAGVSAAVVTLSAVWHADFAALIHAMRGK